MFKILTTIQQEPATALPWEINGGTQVIDKDDRRAIGTFVVADDAYQAAHAVNTYPVLVDTLRRLTYTLHGEGLHFEAQEVEALLKKIGE